MASQAPSIHSFDAIFARCGVRFGKTPVSQLGAPRLKIGKRQAKQFGDRTGRYVTAERDAMWATHSAPSASFSINPSSRARLQALTSTAVSRGRCLMSAAKPFHRRVQFAVHRIPSTNVDKVSALKGRKADLDCLASA